MRLVGIDEIKENDYNLNISRYIDTSEAADEIDLAAVNQKIQALKVKEEAIDEKLAGLLSELGL